MPADPTEATRKRMIGEINREPGGRAALEAEHGEVYDTNQLQEAFTVLGYMAPFVNVTRKSDGVTGTLLFQRMPRYYYGFEPEG